MTTIRELPSLAATEAFGHELALLAAPGSAILLAGELGAGKTTLARAIIRSLSGTKALEVPSPTFSLVQTYETTRMPVAHADLYRIAATADLGELGLGDLARTHLLLIEWPDRLREAVSDDCLAIRLESTAAGRRAHLEGSGRWKSGLPRLETIAGFLKQASYGAAKREFLEGDASFRRYERLTDHDESLVLMDMPARPDGPPVKHGKPYSAIAHLAENIKAVLAVNAYLCSQGYSAPRTCAHYAEGGLAVIEDLGSRVYAQMMRAGEDMSEPMAMATLVLADMATKNWPSRVPVPGNGDYAIPFYDFEAQTIETELLLDWYWPFLTGRDAPQDACASFADIWAGLLPLTRPERPVWTLRDYHSPNLMWLPDRKGFKRVGLIDTQDCVLGHPAYDLASMLRDARVDVSFPIADDLFEYYCAERASAGSFDKSEFARAFAILSVQRTTKILGIFARLSRRDGKHVYIRHMPRVSRYLERDLHHPALIQLKGWYDRYLPEKLRSSAA